MEQLINGTTIYVRKIIILKKKLKKIRNNAQAIFWMGSEPVRCLHIRFTTLALTIPETACGCDRFTSYHISVIIYL